MADIAHVASATANANNSTASHTVTIPAETQADDILVYHGVNRDSTADPSVVDNDSDGNTWAKFAGGATGQSLWWKRATSGTASKTITASGFTGSSTGTVSVFRNCLSSGTPLENATTESNASGNEAHAGINPSENGAYVVLCVANRTNDTITISSPSTTNPGALAIHAQRGSTGGSDCYVALAGARQATAGATGNFTWSQTNSTTVSTVFNLLPAPTVISGTGATASPAQNISGASAALVQSTTSAAVAATQTATATGGVLVRATAAASAAPAQSAAASGTVTDQAIVGTGSTRAAVHTTAAIGGPVVQSTDATTETAAQDAAGGGSVRVAGDAEASSARQQTAASGGVAALGLASLSAAAQGTDGAGEPVAQSTAAITVAAAQDAIGIGSPVIHGTGGSVSAAQELFGAIESVSVGAGATAATAPETIGTGGTLIQSAGASLAAGPLLAGYGISPVSGSAAIVNTAQACSGSAAVGISGAVATYSAAQSITGLFGGVVVPQPGPTVATPDMSDSAQSLCRGVCIKINYLNA